MSEVRGAGIPAARFDAIDALRGLVIVLMVVDHAREYSAGTGRVADPMQLRDVTPLLFAMRWITHFCAPVFTLLAGMSAGFTAADDHTDPRQSDRARAAHLITRGLILVLLEFTVVHLAWTFSFVWPMRYAQVIWGLGVSMIVLGMLQYAPRAFRLLLGVACVAGHNLLDGWHPTEPALLHWIWAVLHDRQVMPLWGDLTVRTSYPVLPMIGLMLVGEAAGRWYARTTPARRVTWLTRAGVGSLVLFLVLRLTNSYGDPHDAAFIGNALQDSMSVLNVTKYPMSLSFILMTLGPALLLLARWDRRVPRWAAPLCTLGNVPMFLYIGHLYLLHATALVWAVLAGAPLTAFDFRRAIGGMPAEFGFPLWVTIPYALVIVLLLWKPAQWYAALRRSKRYAFTRFV
jgi:uncharacterized membrane protein